MRRTRLRNKFIDSKTNRVRIVFNKQYNYCVILIPKEKKFYFNILKYVTQRTIKPFREN